jgi:thiamine kinase-like enzyme
LEIRRELDDRIERVTGSRPVRYETRGGGYSTADRFTVTLGDGARVFVKSSDDANLASWIRREHEVYAALQGRSFMPELVGFDDDGGRAVLVIEDLSDAEWTPRWDDTRVQAVLDASAELAHATPPPNTHDVRVTHAGLWDRWETVRRDPSPFLSLGLRHEAWLERALPQILDAVERAPVSGGDVCHLDLRSDNMCFRGDRVALVDWNWTSLADRRADVAAWLPSLHVEGGPPPWDVLAGLGEVAAWIAGVWAAVAGTPPPPTAPNVRALQRAQLAVALDWVDRELLR